MLGLSVHPAQTHIKGVMTLHRRIKPVLSNSLLYSTLLHQICRPKASQTDPLNEMHVQLVIPIPDDHTSVRSHTAPVVVSHTNVSSLSYAALRDPDQILYRYCVDSVWILCGFCVGSVSSVPSVLSV